MFQKHTPYIVTTLTKGVSIFLHLKSIGVYFHTEYRKITPTAHRSTACSQFRIRQWHDIYVLHFRWLIEFDPKLVSAIIFLPLSFMITFCELTLYTFHFYRFIQRYHSKRKIWKPLPFRTIIWQWKRNWKCCTWMWKPHTILSYMFDKTNLIQNII